MSVLRGEVDEDHPRATLLSSSSLQLDRDGAACLRHLDMLASAKGIVLAVSGGPDSTALMHLAAAWRREAERPAISVASVDHGLREGSRQDAEAVVEHARQRGFRAELLVWDGEKPKRGIQSRARGARYALLAAMAHRIGASHLVTAHTQDDQAETMLMRLARGSGITGLRAMSREAALRGLTLSRPFLAVPKPTLLRLCRDNAWTFTQDPSNRDPAYARSRWRALAPSLAREGLTAERLAKLAVRLARADDAIEVAVAAARQAAAVDDPREPRLLVTALARNPIEVALRVVATVLREVAPERQPRLERLEALTAKILEANRSGRPLRRTLNGCVVTLEAGILAVEPEPRRQRGTAREG